MWHDASTLDAVGATGMVRLPQRYGPKVIWSLWLQGLEEAPDLVRACLASWTNRNPGWVHHLLTRDTLPLFLPEARNEGSLLARDLPPAALSDVVRVGLLSRFGGVWVDATCYCLHPLDDWLAEAMRAGFFVQPGLRRVGRNLRRPWPPPSSTASCTTPWSSRSKAPATACVSTPSASPSTSAPRL